MLNLLRSIAVGAFIFIAPASLAQIPGVSVGLGGGPSFPVGTFSDNLDPGYHLQGTANVSIILLPVDVRANLAYHRLPDERGGHGSLVSGDVNVRLEIPTFPVLVSPYVLGGVGIYRTAFSEDHGISHNAETRTDFGINAGAGIEINLMILDLFVEARAHNVFASAIGNRPFIPVTLGVMF
ncbi:MAG: hypothetical protein ACOCTG_06935 [Bacteroidota bacterium]